MSAFLNRQIVLSADLPETIQLPRDEQDPSILEERILIPSTSTAQRIYRPGIFQYLSRAYECRTNIKECWAIGSTAISLPGMTRCDHAHHVATHKGFFEAGDNNM